jgi:hypothetical protein
MQIDLLTSQQGGGFDQRWFNGGSDDTSLLPLLLLKIRSVRMLDMIVCSGPSVWLFSPVWDAVKLTREFGFICPFVVIDPTDEATPVIAPGRMIDNILPIPDAESLPLYRMALKLACVSTRPINGSGA